MADLTLPLVCHPFINPLIPAPPIPPRHCLTVASFSASPTKTTPAIRFMIT